MILFSFSFLFFSLRGRVAMVYDDGMMIDRPSISASIYAFVGFFFPCVLLCCEDDDK